MKKSLLYIISGTLIIGSTGVVLAESSTENLATMPSNTANTMPNMQSNAIESSIETESEISPYSDETESEYPEEQRVTEHWDVTLPQETETVNGVVFTKEDGESVNDAIDNDDINRQYAAIIIQNYYEQKRDNTEYPIEDISDITDEVTKIEVSGNSEVSPRNLKGYTLSIPEVSEFISTENDWVNIGKPENFIYEPYLDIRFYFGDAYLDTWTLTTDYDIVTSDGDILVDYNYNYKPWFENIEKTYGFNQDTYVDRYSAGTYFGRGKWASEIDFIYYDDNGEEVFIGDSAIPEVDTAFSDVGAGETYVDETEEEIDVNENALSSNVLDFFKNSSSKFEIEPTDDDIDYTKLHNVIYVYAKNGDLLYEFATKDFENCYLDNEYKVSGRELEEFLEFVKLDKGLQ